MKRSEMEELKAAEEEKNKKKGKKSRSRSGSPNKRPTTDMQKNKSSDKKDRMGSGKYLHFFLFCSNSIKKKTK